MVSGVNDLVYCGRVHVNEATASSTARVRWPGAADEHAPRLAVAASGRGTFYVNYLLAMLLERKLV